MKLRHQKKRLKKALNVLNDIEVVDSDYDSENVLNISIEDDIFNYLIIKEFCQLLKINLKEFMETISQEKEDTGYLDLSFAWYFLKEIRGYEIWHSNEGFSLKKRKWVTE